MLATAPEPEVEVEAGSSRGLGEVVVMLAATSSLRMVEDTGSRVPCKVVGG